jgi:putative ABC transport system permease protein
VFPRGLESARIRVALARARGLFRRRARSHADAEDEFAFHIDMETAENIRRGMSEVDARRAALLRFGGTQRFREATSDARGVVALDNLARDTRFALRRVKHAPGFAAAVMATIGIGVGAAVGIGSIVYGVLLRDLPYAKANQLVHVGFHTDGLAAPGDLQSPATFVHFAQRAHSVSDLGAYFTSDAFALTDGDAAESITVALMSPSTFDLLGVRPVRGALFARKDTSWVGIDGQLLPVLISQDLWERRYGADPAIIGRRIEIDHGERKVIGVMPRSFQFPTPRVSLWYPIALSLKHPTITDGHLTVIGRLRDGVTANDAQGEFNFLLPALSTRFPEITPDMLQRSRARITVESLRAATVAPVRAQLVLLAGLVALILLIATTNAVNLFLLRTERAASETAIALSLGASRLAIGQRFLVEGVVLGVASAVVAFPVAALALSTKFGFTDLEIPRLHEVTFTSGTVMLIVLCAAVVGTTLGLIAIARTRTARLFDQLRTARTSSTRGWRRVQHGLAALQVAIALTLLVAAGLLGRSFWNLTNARIGFEPIDAMTLQVSLPWGPTGYTAYGAQAVLYATLMDRLAALPGVTSVGGALHIPLRGRGTVGYEVQLQEDDGGGRPKISATGNMATAGYFRAMGIPLRRGRIFQSGDLRGAPGVVVSERLAMSIFGTTDILGRVIGKLPAQPGVPSAKFRVIGVVGDIPRQGIEDGDTPMVYFPLLRDRDGLPPDGVAVPYRAQALQIVLRGPQLPGASAIRRIVSEVDPRIPAAGIRSLGSVVDDATARVRLTMLLIAIAGMAALLLGVIGVYSVLSYIAAERMREFGIRLALGAAPRRIASLVLGDGLRLVTLGVLAGLVAALSVTRFLRSLLYGVGPTSVIEFGLATLLLVVVAFCATLLPALRAARTPPAVVLRGG